MIEWPAQGGPSSGTGQGYLGPRCLIRNSLPFV